MPRGRPSAHGVLDLNRNIYTQMQTLPHRKCSPARRDRYPDLTRLKMLSPSIKTKVTRTNNPVCPTARIIIMADVGFRPPRQRATPQSQIAPKDLTLQTTTRKTQTKTEHACAFIGLIIKGLKFHGTGKTPQRIVCLMEGQEIPRSLRHTRRLNNPG